MSTGDIVKLVAGFLFVTALTILAERWISDRAAIVVLLVSLGVLAWFQRNHVQEILIWSRGHRTLAVTICVLLFTMIGLSAGLWITRSPTQSTKSPSPSTPPPSSPSLPPAVPEEPQKPANNSSALQRKPESLKPAVTFSAYSQPDEPYIDGTLLAGLVWQKRFVDVRLDVANSAVPIQNLDFLVGLDTSIAGVGQISQFPGITAFPAKTPPAAWLQGTDLQGNPISVPMAPMPGKMQTAPVYRVHCSAIFADTVVHLVIASIALNPPENGQLPKQLFAPRKSPELIRLRGSYEVQSGSGLEKHSVEFSYRFAQTPSASARPLTLEEMFQSDFSGGNKWSYSAAYKSATDGATVPIEEQMHLDYQGYSRFLSFYLPVSPLAYEAALWIGDHSSEIIGQFDKNEVISRDATEQHGTSDKELKFSGRVFIYTLSDLTLDQQADLERQYRANGLALEIRGLTYMSFTNLQRAH
jgi:hypothetical protein